MGMAKDENNISDFREDVFETRHMQYSVWHGHVGLNNC